MGHQLDVSLPPGQTPVDTDPVRLAQIVSNLLNNAAKYTDPGGQIRLSVVATDLDVVIRVGDSGRGIDEEQLPLIFDQFTQVQRFDAQSQGGLGMGLSLVKRLVALHHGTVEAFSAGPGAGSEFRVRLPRWSSASQPAVSAPEPAQAPRGFDILVVDDNPDAAGSLAMLLELMGHQVRVAHDGPAALDLVAHHRPDVVLLDIGMPGMDGFETCRRLRTMTGGAEIRVIAVTGWGQDEDRRNCGTAGFDAHLVKPVAAAILERTLCAPTVAASAHEHSV